MGADTVDVKLHAKGVIMRAVEAEREATQVHLLSLSESLCYNLVLAKLDWLALRLVTQSAERESVCSMKSC